MPREERIKGYKDVRLIWSEDLLPEMEEGCTPIAVEYRRNAEDLFEFEHPKDPVYIFGPEDGSLDRSLLVCCHRFVKIDTMECLNLACAVSTVLYDQRLKEHWGR